MIVDEDRLFRESLRIALIKEGHRVTEFSSATQLLDWMSPTHVIDAVILDWVLPELSGIDALQIMRERKVNIPIIFFTKLADRLFEEAALMAGANDFIEKSRGFSVLLKRVELATRMSYRNGSDDEAPKRVSLGQLELQLDSHRAYWRGMQVPLTHTEFQMVHLMVSQCGQDVSFRDLYDMVHGEGFFAGLGENGYRVNVRTAMKRIRQKFRLLDDAFDEIKSYTGFGYRWSGKQQEEAGCRVLELNDSASRTIPTCDESPTIRDVPY